MHILISYNKMAMQIENYDPYYPDQPVVVDYLPIWAKLPAFHSKPAFIWAVDSGESSDSITYAELNLAVEAMAAELLLRIKRGDAIIILCSPGLQLVKLIFASQRAGLVAVPVVPTNHDQLFRAVAQTHPAAVVADSDNDVSKLRFTGGKLTTLLENLQWLAIEDLEGNIISQETHLKCTSCGPNDTYLVQYTSGATGIPKPVMVTAGAAAHNVRAARRAYDLHPGSVIVSWLPQYHDCGLMFLLLSIVAGATCVLTSPFAFLRRPQLWLELVSEHKATCTPVPSFALPLVLKRGRSIDQVRISSLNLSSLKNLILVNEPIYKSSVDEFVKEFGGVGMNPNSVAPSYGLAENCTFVSTSWRKDSLNNMPSYKQLVPSARLDNHQGTEDIEIVVVDEETYEPVEDGAEGEIWISSPSNASEYLDHPSLTREVFYARLNGVLGRRFVRTGDRGVVVGRERYLYVTGRSSDLINLQNRMVHSHYIETAAYESCPEKLRGGCVAAFSVMQNSRAMVILVAELQRGGSENGDCRRICEGVREALWKREGVEVGAVVLVKSGSVCKTTSGKLRRWLVKDDMINGKLPVVYEANFVERIQGQMEEMVAEMVGTVELAGAAGEVMASLYGGPRRQPLRSHL